MVYEKFFYLKENPFNITPDPKFLYLSKKHQEALDLLYFGVSQRKGFLMVSGEVGTGKTTLCRALLDKLNSNVQSAFVLNPLLSDMELLRTINEDFGLKVDGSSLKEQVDALNSFLLRKAEDNKNVAVIIDEAQNMSLKALEMVRLLSNLETEKMKLLQIVLIGQPELREKLKLPELRQLNQRIVVRYHLGSLNFEETKAYIFKRLTIAGGRGNIRFTSTALKSIYEASSGIPRLVNIICDRGLTAAFVEGKRVIDDEIQKKAINELDRDGTLRKDVDIQPKRRWRRWRYVRYLPIPAIIVAVIFIIWWKNKNLFVISHAEGVPVIKAVPTVESSSNSLTANAAVQFAAPKQDTNPAISPSSTKINSATHGVTITAETSKEVETQEPPPSQTQTASEIANGSDKTLAAQHDEQNISQYSEDAAVKERSVFKGLIILVNGIEHTVGNNEVLEVAKGDKIKIVDAILAGVSGKDVSVNLLGFVPKKAVNTGEDRGYVVDTAKDLRVNYSVRKQGVEYPVIIKHANKKMGEVFIKIISPVRSPLPKGEGIS
ncbi:MAG: AAA family ATPase [Deltaproteobacteria bacterium]|nr:AAA family ATPase [Deltaproteobacteria bacterium]